MEVFIICLHGTYKLVSIINPNQIRKNVEVDACIADEIQYLNNRGVITLGSCCGHGKAGKIVEWENKYGKWKEAHQPPISLINAQSVELALKLGYKPFPYYYADGTYRGVWNMILQSGCVTEEDCKNWHLAHDIPYREDVGIIN